MLECHWKSTFGVECLGCGFQRSVISLLEGNIVESLKLFPATIPLLVTLIYTLLHIGFSFKHGARNIIILFATSATLMVVHLILKFF